MSTCLDTLRRLVEALDEWEVEIMRPKVDLERAAAVEEEFMMARAEARELIDG